MGYYHRRAAYYSRNESFSRSYNVECAEDERFANERFAVSLLSTSESKDTFNVRGEILAGRTSRLHCLEDA